MMALDNMLIVLVEGDTAGNERGGKQEQELQRAVKLTSAAASAVGSGLR